MIEANTHLNPNTRISLNGRILEAFSMSFRKVRILSLLLFNIFSEFNTLFLKKKMRDMILDFFKM